MPPEYFCRRDRILPLLMLLPPESRRCSCGASALLDSQNGYVRLVPYFLSAHNPQGLDTRPGLGRAVAWAATGPEISLDWERRLAFRITPKSGPLATMETLLDANRALTNDFPPGYLRKRKWLEPGKTFRLPSK